MKKHVIKSIASAAVCAAAAGSASAENFRLTIGAGHTIESVSAYGGSVCKLGECLEAVESGLLDIADLHVAFEPSKLMAHNFPYFVPFGRPDPRVASKAARKVYDTVPELKKILEDRYNQIFLAVGAVGAVPVQSNLNEAYTSFQTGVYGAG